MKLENHIACLFDDAKSGKSESAMMHACIAVDATAKKMYPFLKSKSQERFCRCLREYYWLIEPMIGGGVDLVETRFENLGPPHFKTAPDMAEFIYKVHRCAHAHGDEVPFTFSLIPTNGPTGSFWKFGKDHLQIPDRVIWALTSVVVFSRENYRHLGWGGNRCLTFDQQKFPLAEWWGREKDVRPLADKWNLIRVKVENLGGVRTAEPATGSIAHVIIGPPKQA